MSLTLSPLTSRLQAVSLIRMIPVSDCSELALCRMVRMFRETAGVVRHVLLAAEVTVPLLSVSVCRVSLLLCCRQVVKVPRRGILALVVMVRGEWVWKVAPWLSTATCPLRVRSPALIAL